MQRSKTPQVSSAVLVVGLSLVYLLTARLGFELAVVAEQVTLVWPPSGIALAALLLFGRRAWPGVTLGAFMANASTGEPLAVAFSIAVGNTLEGLVALELLTRVGFRPNLQRLFDALVLVLLAAGLSSTVAATIGSFSLVVGGVQPWSAFSSVWRDWWIGDAVGDLTVAPALLAWFESGRLRRPTVRYSAVALALATLAVCGIAFARPPGSAANAYPVYYLAFPVVAWGALRFGIRGSSLVVLAVGCAAVVTTRAGFGPFVARDPEEPLLLLQLFVSVLALTGLLLGATVSERDAAHEDLKLQDRRKDQFLATLAHELRNPLAPLVAATHLLRSKCDDAATVRRLEPILSRQLAHLTRLVDDLLDVSRITSGKVRVEHERVDLHEVIERALEMSQPLLRGRNIELLSSLPEEHVEVRGDLARLIQVVFNLVSNAVRYGKDQGHIWLSVETQGNEAVVSVRDDGQGMTDEVLGRAFELFAQGPATGGGAGLGLGLTLVRQLVELHGGSVSAHSEGPGKGSEFMVRLPLFEKAPERRDTGAREPPPSSRPETGGPLKPREVLVVDDNVDAAVTLARLVELRGHHVEMVHGGRAALDRLRTSVPDVILLDIEMPDVTGYEVARTVRRDERLRDVRLIAVTGYGQPGDDERARAAGFDAHMVKPVAPEALNAALEAGPARP